MVEDSQKKWHSLSIEEVLSRLNSSTEGLSSRQVKLHQDKFGLNQITTKKKSWLLRLIEPFTSLFIIVLLIAIVISLATHENFDAAIIAVVVTVNALIFYFQQYSVNKVLADLKNKEDGNVTVIRDKEKKEISTKELVPGDIIFIFEGTKIPTDGRIIETSNLEVDESILTGESLPTIKNPQSLDQKVQIYDQKNMLFKGTIVQSGSGQMVVTETGNNTELGSISSLASESDIGKTPIEKKIDSITRTLVFSITAVGAIVFILSMLRGITIDESLRFTLSLVVSIVPEGLPVILTVVLLLSAKKMASKQVLVKKLSAIETMGAITLIATDKTGTITKNKLRVTEFFPNNESAKISIGSSIVMQNGIATDPLDKVLIQTFKNEKSKFVSSLPFNQQLRMSGAIVMDSDKYTLFVKGAPEEIFKKAKPSAQIKKIFDDYTKKGYRTIAFAKMSVPGPTSSLEKVNLSKLELESIVGLSDPMRSNIPSAITNAHKAGINVVMLTGDHVATAGEIAKQAGLISSEKQVSTGNILEKPINKKMMKTVLSEIKVFGRVLPKHKFNFLKSVKGTEITAMTGDGVNDIPALVEADAGLAMGSGTDAAKDASDIVLLNDNFSTIIEAVRLGRSVMANISKMLFYLISTSIGEVVAMISALLLGLPLPVTAVQILWINLVTDTFTVLPIGLSRPEKHQMARPPKNPKSPLLSKILIQRTVLTGLLIGSVAIFVFWLLLPKGYAYAQTAAFLTIISAQWANALNANYEINSWILNLIKPNFRLWLGISVSVLLQALVFYGPLSEAFGIVDLSNQDLLVCTVLPFAVILFGVDLHKLVTRFMPKYAAE